MLRTAQALADAKVPPRRITQSLRELRRHLPDAMPLSGLSIGAVADRVVVREGGSRWQAESGQYLLAFDGDPADGSLSVIERADADEASPSARGVVRPRPWRWSGKTPTRRWRPTSARSPPIRAFLDAHINLGRLLHEAGRLAKAERVYRDAIKACGNDPVLLYNLGVLLDDMDRKRRGDGRVRGGAARRSRPSPMATTTWRCCTKSSANRRTRSGTWRGIAR